MDLIFKIFVRFETDPGNLWIAMLRRHWRECPGMESVYLGVQEKGDAVLRGGITDRDAGQSGRCYE